MDKQDRDVQAEEPERDRTQGEGTEARTAGRAGAEGLEAAAGPLTSGQIVNGLIVHIDEQGALVDVGTKSEGHIPASELVGGTTEEGKPLAVGDRVEVYVVRPEDEDGSPVLSKKKADYERVWQRLTWAHERGEVLTAMVTDRVKGGLVVDLGMRGFLPASHVLTRNVHALDRFVGQSVRVKIVEVDRDRKRVVVSQKDAIEQERRKRREQTVAALEENKVYKGIVRRIADYGAFVDIGGVDGLLHITEMSWTRINHPSDVVKVGDRIDVMVLRFDREQNRISLGLKQILPDPWEQASDQFKVGQMVTGTVTRVVPFGAFVRLATGIEGIVPQAEMPGSRGRSGRGGQEAVAVGDSVQVKIVSIRPAERRIALSLRQVEQAQERRELKEYMDRQQASSRVTIADLVGDVFGEARVADPQAEEEQEVPAAEAAPEGEDLPASEEEPQSAEPEPGASAGEQEACPPQVDESAGGEGVPAPDQAPFLDRSEELEA